MWVRLRQSEGAFPPAEEEAEDHHAADAACASKCWAAGAGEGAWGQPATGPGGGGVGDDEPEPC